MKDKYIKNKSRWRNIIVLSSSLFNFKFIFISIVIDLVVCISEDLNLVETNRIFNFYALTLFLMAVCALVMFFVGVIGFCYNDKKLKKNIEEENKNE